MSLPVDNYTINNPKVNENYPQAVDLTQFLNYVINRTIIFAINTYLLYSQNSFPGLNYCFTANTKNDIYQKNTTKQINNKLFHQKISKRIYGI